MEDIRGSICKLNGVNYQTWKFKLKLLLTKEGLWDVVEDGVPALPAMTADWKMKDGKAKAVIGLLVEDSELITIKNLSFAKHYWDALKEVHEKPNLTNKVSLYRKLWKCHQESDSVECHLNNILSIVDELKALGEQIKDSMVVGLMLSSLSENFNPLVSALETKPENELTINFVKEKLVQADSRFGNNKESGDYQVLKSSKKFAKGKFVKCYNCGRKGHTKPSCPHLKHVQIADCEDEENQAECLTTIGSGRKDDCWYLDSGATDHMCRNNQLFSKIRPKAVQENIKVADGRYVQCGATGDVLFNCESNGKSSVMHLKDVNYVPKLSSNLISVNKLSKSGYKIVFTGDFCEISQEGRFIMKIKAKANGLYELKPVSTVNFVANEKVQTDCIHTWHLRFGHRNMTDISKMIKDKALDGVTLRSCECPRTDVCRICCEGKFVRQKFPKKRRNKTYAFFDLVHSDLCGPFDVATPAGHRYFLTMIEDQSRYCHIYFLKRKSDAYEKFKEYIAFVKNKFGKCFKTLRSDRGGEYIICLRKLETY